MFVTTFFFVGLVTALLNESDRTEESSLFISLILGMRLAAVYASGLAIAQNDSEVVVDWVRESIGSAFFSFWLASISLGFLAMVLIRGTVEKKGSGSFFRTAPHNQRESRCCSILCIDIRLFHDSTCLVRTIRQSG